MTQKINSLNGFHDILPSDVNLWQKIELAAHAVLSCYGFSEIRTPVLESTELFSRGVGEGTQVVQKEMYTFNDRSNESLTLRPEGTAGVVRAYIEHSMFAGEAVTKLYYSGPMFRYERPQKGRLREFHQFGVEVLGSDSVLSDVESIIVADRIFKSLGIKDYDLRLNNIGTLAERANYLTAVKSYFWEFRESLCADCKVRLEANPLRIFDCKVESCRVHFKKAPSILNFLTEETSKEFEILKSELKAANVNFTVDDKIVRGLDYYEKTAFEFVSSELGSQSTFAAGGRYNRLVEELGGPKTPSVGFAIGMERLVLILKAQNTEVLKRQKGVCVIALGAEAFSLSRKLAQDLRDSGVIVSSEYQERSFKAQMRRADKSNLSHALILGENEVKAGQIILKSLETGEQELVEFKELQAKVLAL